MNESGRLFSVTVASWLTRASGLEAKLAYSFVLENGANYAEDCNSSGGEDRLVLSVAEYSDYGRGLATYLLEDLLEENSAESHRLDRLNRTREFGWLPVRAALRRGLIERGSKQEIQAISNDSLPSGWLHSGAGAGAGFQVYCELNHQEVLLATGGGGGGGGLSIPFSGAPTFGGGGGGGLQLRYFLNTTLDKAGNLPPLSPWESFGGGSGCNSIPEEVVNENQNLVNDSKVAISHASAGRCAAQPALGGAAASCGRSFDDDDDSSDFSNVLFSYGSSPGAALRESVQQCVKWRGRAVVRGGGGGGGGTTGASCDNRPEPTSGRGFGFGFGFLAVAGQNATIPKEGSDSVDILNSSNSNRSNRSAAVANLKISQLVRNASSTKSSAAACALGSPVVECPWSCRCEDARFSAYQQLVEQRQYSQSKPEGSPQVDNGQVHALISALVYTRCGDCISMNSSIAATNEQLYRCLLTTSAKSDKEMGSGVRTDVELAAEPETDSPCWTAAADQVPPHDGDENIAFLVYNNNVLLEGVEAPIPSELENNCAPYLRRVLNPVPLDGCLALALALGAVMLWRRRRTVTSYVVGRQKYIELPAVAAAMPTRAVYKKCAVDSCGIRDPPVELTSLVL